MTQNPNQQTRLVTAFATGRDFTTGQIASRLKISKSRARYLITELRARGYAIYRNRKTLQSGTVANVYRLGMPSRAMVARAFALDGADLFN